MAYRKKDIGGDVDPAAPWRDVPLHRPVTYRVTQYPAGAHIAGHKHQRHQLVYAISGLMVVRSEVGRWVVPSTRAIWMPAGMVHAVDCIAAVHMRSLYIDPSFAPQLPAEPFAVQVAPLLRELLQAATLIKGEHIEDSRDGRVVRLLLDELHRMDVLPLHLPAPADPRLQRICRHLQKHPGDDATLQDWAQALEVDVKTIQRHFANELGMTFGQWRQQARLLAAMERLATGEKVIDVALAMGYDSPSAFTSMFKRQLGQTPAAFFR
ncbi:helix-turn-helix transcriptional regulator [Stenotrophomonas maltophilia]|jgi:AraC-like DNA-binding protein|uniref:AraC family transcriptional regulator n=1 Tax=Stenotrophomonas maltophilia TaxID=40324 RepID=UPI0015DDFDEE|nr:helix-turn-helix transcriptional regulator [Stenotrophomonas maltophilia]MBA0222593.1 AraC family transcriptional regulator [Stenotrophomonas maltophilia]MCU1092894.1 helix-turn-helix transcriptional regulator [Stenotrophomonas maltophilia]HEL4259804.1 helix-turn-helix transcriptional regulator [Stenotrophomonas maltophilia]